MLVPEEFGFLRMPGDVDVWRVLGVVVGYCGWGSLKSCCCEIVAE